MDARLADDDGLKTREIEQIGEGLVAQAGLDYAVSSLVSLGISYSGQFGQRATDNAFKGNLDISF